MITLIWTHSRRFVCVVMTKIEHKCFDKLWTSSFARSSWHYNSPFSALIIFDQSGIEPFLFLKERMPLCDPRPLNQAETFWIVEDRAEEFTLQKNGMNFSKDSHLRKISHLTHSNIFWFDISSQFCCIELNFHFYSKFFCITSSQDFLFDYF
jgi:hypothetical protein